MEGNNLASLLYWRQNISMSTLNYRQNRKHDQLLQTTEYRLRIQQYTARRRAAGSRDLTYRRLAAVIGMMYRRPAAVIGTPRRRRKQQVAFPQLCVPPSFHACTYISLLLSKVL